MSATASRVIDADGIDLRATLKTQAMYPRDPTSRLHERSFAKAVLTPDGPGTLVLEWSSEGRVDATGHGPGATWLLDGVPELIGLHDSLDGFDPALDPQVAEWWRRHGRFRLSRGRVVWQELVLVILGQRVTTESAVDSFARLCRNWAGPAPGPVDLRLPPTAGAVGEIDLAAFHRIGVERQRATAIRRAASRADRLEEAATMPTADALTRLTALPGLGPWTATSVVAVSHGDPDTVILRDLKIPTLVNYAFTGDGRRLPPESGDQVMLEHLAPWSGHRQRVVRLLFSAGVAIPRRGAKRANPDIRRL